MKMIQPAVTTRDRKGLDWTGLEYTEADVALRDNIKSAEFSGKGRWVAFRAPLKVCKEGQ